MLQGQHGLRETSHPLGLCGGEPLRHSDWLSQIDSNRHHHSAVEGQQQQTRLSSATRVYMKSRPEITTKRFFSFTFQ